MKKLLIVSLLVVVLMLLAVSAASANGGPHGDYTATTDACAGCHRAHTGAGDNLLIASDTYTLCITCHGSSGNGANTNVADGIYLERTTREPGETTTADDPLLGGQFANTTSTHDSLGTATGAWGEGTAGRGEQGSVDPLDCASCHDPHGSTNYRIIKTTINDFGVSVDPVDETAKDYSNSSWTTAPKNSNSSWTTDLNAVCEACHAAYGEVHDTNHKVVGGIGSKTPSYTDTDGTTVAVPLTTDSQMICQTCHFPHGTAATMTAGGPADGAGPAGSSALLREDNRGVCQACHEK